MDLGRTVNKAMTTFVLWTWAVLWSKALPWTLSKCLLARSQQTGEGMCATLAVMVVGDTDDIYIYIHIEIYEWVFPCGFSKQHVF